MVNVSEKDFSIMFQMAYRYCSTRNTNIAYTFCNFCKSYKCDLPTEVIENVLFEMECDKDLTPLVTENVWTENSDIMQTAYDVLEEELERRNS